MTDNGQPRSGPVRRELRLWPVGWALIFVFIAAVVVAGCVLYSLMRLLELDFQEIDKAKKLDAKTLFDLVKLSFGVVAGAGALVALVVAYRRQRVEEAGARREATRLHTERFSQAVEQLGSDSPAVRLGGVHALAGLADDAPGHSLRQTCIDVLCTYLQLPFTPDPGIDPEHQEEHHRYLAFRKVRHTILRLIGDHYRRPQGTHGSWQGCDLDLTGVTLDGSMDFTGAVFSGGRVSFDHTVFSGGEVSFTGAKFSRGGAVSFTSVTIDGNLDFTEAEFFGGQVSFNDAIFSSGRVSFNDAKFSSGRVSFNDAKFSSGRVSFNDAIFSGGEVSFDRASFSGGQVSFDPVDFHGEVSFGSGSVRFDRAEFSGGSVHFDQAVFGGEVSFDYAVFGSGSVRFDRAEFSSGRVSFNRAEFSGGRVSFYRAEFSASVVSFTSPRFAGGEVSFEHVSGPAPDGLLTSVSGPDSSTDILLPTRWRSS